MSPADMQAANSVDLHRLEVYGCKRATIATPSFRARKRVKLLCHRSGERGVRAGFYWDRPPHQSQPRRLQRLDKSRR